MKASKPQLTRLSDLSTCKPKIRMLKPAVFSEHHQVIKLLSIEKQPVLFQTDACHVLYCPSYDVYGNVKVCIASTKDQDCFTEMRALELTIAKAAKVANKAFIPSVSDDGRIWRLRNKADGLYLFDMNGNAIPDKAILSSLTVPFKVRALVRMDSVWISKFCYGVTFALQQLQILEHHYDVSTLLMDSPIDSVTPNLPPETVDRFRKMLKVGVPAPAVKEKMRLEGHSNSIIDSFFGTSSHVTTNIPPNVPPAPRPPPPPPHLPPISITNGLAAQRGLAKVCCAMGAVLDAIKVGGIKLKTVTATTGTREDIKKDVLKAVDITKRVPTLDEILSARGTLKRVEKMYYVY